MATTKKTAKKKATAKKAPAKATAAKKNVIKKVWDYIKKNDLKDKAKR